MGYFLQNVTARNVLSFGPSGMSLDLRPLNVLIGANGSGKSNLLEVISLLQAAPRELSAPCARRRRHRRLDLAGPSPTPWQPSRPWLRSPTRNLRSSIR